MNKNKKEEFLERIIEKIFNIDKKKYYILLLFIIGFSFRSLTAIGRKFSGDEMVHGTHAIGFINSGKLGSG